MKSNQNNKKRKTVVIGMSGGVDSSVATLLLKKQGYNVIGAFMKCFSETKNPFTGECSWIQERKMAQKIALILEIPLYTFDFEKQYKKQVIEPMYKSYAMCLTPNPDISCNTIIKFPLFWKQAKKLHADYIAMGHYARIKKTSKKYELLTGKDKSKDQSYFLYELSQSDLSHTLFPLGNLTKERVRKIAKKNHFPNWNKPGTSGVCFIGKVNFHEFLKKKIKGKEGEVIDSSENVIGKHKGIMFYTIGQRVGSHINIEIDKPHGSEGKKYYVADKLKPNTLIVAPEGHGSLKKKAIYINKIHFINNKFKGRLKARIRHLGQLHSGILKKQKGKWKFIFNKSIFGIAPGQSIVFYKGNKLVSGGIIQKAI